MRERVIDNSTHIWGDGLLNQQNIKVLDADKVGMQCGYYGGSIAHVELTNTDPLNGMRLFVATVETQFDPYAWRYGMPSCALTQLTKL